MRSFSRIWLGLALIAVAVELRGASVLAPQSVPIESPGSASTIVLPEKIPAGEKGTLAVLDSEGRLVPGATVELSGGARITTDSTGRAGFTAPAQGGTLTAQLPDRYPFATNVTTGITPTSGVWQEIDLGLGFPKVPPKDGPRIIALGDRFAIRGRGFSGDADHNKVSLGGERALVLASSSASLIVLANRRTLLGNTEITIEVEGRNVFRAPVVVVSLAVLGPPRALAAGKKGVVQVAASGTSERLFVEVQNLSPNVVKFPKGDVVQLRTSGGKTNIAKIEVVGVQAGDYAVSARLALSTATGLAEVKGAR